MKHIVNREVELIHCFDMDYIIYSPSYIAYDTFGGRVYEEMYIRGGGAIPKYLGRAYDDVCYNATVFYPIPLNYIVRILRIVHWKIMRGFYWVGLIDISAGEMFTWDDFFRIKTH